MTLLYYKWYLIILLQGFFSTTSNFNIQHPVGEIKHPFHISVTEVNHNAKDKILEISCKIFTNDFENALTRKYKMEVDLVQPKDKASMDKIVSDYINHHLAIKTDNKAATMKYIGFEVESEAVYVYLQVNDVTIIKKAEVTNTILHDIFTDQAAIIHFIVGGNRKSMKIDYPGSVAVFQF